MSIIGIPSTRVSDLFIQQQMLDQMNSDQNDMVQLETELSTGYQFSLPSQNPNAAAQVIGLQELMAQQTQAQTNVNTAQSYLSASDSAMSQISSLLSSVQATALGAMGATATAEEQSTAAQSVQETIQQLLTIGNQNFDGRYLFAGSENGAAPFTAQANGLIAYSGNDQQLPTYAGSGSSIDTNVTGDEVFGAISAPVQSTATLTPNVTADTPLADLNYGQGVAKGSIAISDGTHTSIIDLSNASTVGDAAQLIQANPPAGNTISVQVTPQGLAIQLQSGNLTINNVGGGTTASDLGILNQQGTGTQPLVSSPLDPTIQPTSLLAGLTGTPATAVIGSTGSNDAILLQAASNGADLNGVTVSYVNDPTLQEGQESAVYDANAKTLTVTIHDGVSTTSDVIGAITAGYEDGSIPFTATLDPLDGSSAASSKLSSQSTPPATMTGGSGEDLDTSGLEIVNNGTTYTISLAGDKTVQDLLTTLNNSGAGVVAQISSDGQGIEISSKVSGCDFMIGENGGTTATQLGLRTFTAATPLDQLNYGQGVGTNPDGGTDFTITRSDGVSFNISLQGCQTVGDVINAINTNPTNLATGTPLVAQLAKFGNGIELVDNSGGTGTLTVTANPASTAAEDLGLIPATLPDPTASPTSQTVPVLATGSLGGAADMTATFTDATPLAQLNGGAGVGTNPTGGTDFTITRSDGVSFDVSLQGADTIGDVLNAINDNPTNLASGKPVVAQLNASGTAIQLVDYSAGSGNLTVTANSESIAAVDLGLVPAGQTSNANTTTPLQVLTGGDVNQQETEGIFTALLRLQDGLENANSQNTQQQAAAQLQIQQAMNLLTTATTNFNFTNAEVGARQQGLDSLSTSLSNQNIQLQQTLSQEYDADLPQVISDLTARQTAYQASLQMIAQLSKMTLLDYL
ncbi:MAG: flagellar hook-associated protein FlgL [Thermoguttaceae bacterium]